MIRATNSAICEYPGYVRNCRHGSILQHRQTDNVTSFQLVTDSDSLPVILMPCSVTAAQSQLCHCHYAGTFPIPSLLCWFLKPVSWHFQFFSLTWAATFNRNVWSVTLAQVFFRFCFSELEGKIIKTLGLKLPFEVTESTSLHFTGLDDHSRGGRVNAHIYTMKAQYETTFNGQKNNKTLNQRKQYCILWKEEKISGNKIFWGKITIFKLISIFHLKWENMKAEVLNLNKENNIDMMYTSIKRDKGQISFTSFLRI